MTNVTRRVINVISSTSIPLHNVFIFYFVSRELWNPFSKLSRLLINPIRYYAYPRIQIVYTNQSVRAFHEKFR